MIAAPRHALRDLRRSPTFTVIATLGIDIGLNAVIFAVVDCVLLRRLGYHDADRIVFLQTHFIDVNRSIGSVRDDDYSEVVHQIRGLEATAYYEVWPNGTSVKGAAVQLSVANVSPRFGEVMGVQPIVGRLFRADDADGQDVLVGPALARQHFGIAAAAIGQTIRYNDLSHPIACAALGIGIGIALSLSLARALGSVLGKLPAFDIAAYAIGSIAILSVALLATLLPAQAGANVDPMTVLRSE
jgi:hypothetical protein